MKEWIKYLEAEGLAKGTVKNKIRNVNEFKNKFNIVEPQEITEALVLQYSVHLNKLCLAKCTIQDKLFALKSYCEFLFNKGELIVSGKNFVPNIPRSESIPKTIYSEQEIQNLLTVLSGNRHRRTKAMIEICYSCGLRMQEVIKANFTDINLYEKSFFVKEGKGKKDRIIPLTDQAIESLTDYISTDRARIKPSTSALFVTNKGERIKDQDIQERLYWIRKRFKLSKPITIHVIRHSIATHLLRAGMDITYIQKFLGHENLSTTMLYTRVVPVDLKKMIDAFHPRNSM